MTDFSEDKLINCLNENSFGNTNKYIDLISASNYEIIFFLISAIHTTIISPKSDF